jgi:hypothetical protein
MEMTLLYRDIDKVLEANGDIEDNDRSSLILYEVDIDVLLDSTQDS